MADSDCEGGQLTAQSVAAELYQLAALMLGNESAAAELVEAAVAQTNVDPCADAEASLNAARLHLVETAVARLSQAQPQAFAAPVAASSTGCLQDDDLASAGLLSTAQLASMIRDPGRGALRHWLNKLPVAQRAVFVIRAILGWDNAAAAASLTKAARHSWQPAQVSDLFRRSLCSLATSLAHSAAAQV